MDPSNFDLRNGIDAVAALRSLGRAPDARRLALGVSSVVRAAAWRRHPCDRSS